jgi:hypothetical protein
LKDSAVGNGGGQDVVNAQLDVGTVVPIKDKRELVGRLDAQDYGASAMVRFVWAELRFDALVLQELVDELTHGILAQTGQ